MKNKNICVHYIYYKLILHISKIYIAYLLIVIHAALTRLLPCQNPNLEYSL